MIARLVVNFTDGQQLVEEDADEQLGQLLEELGVHNIEWVLQLFALTHLPSLAGSEEVKSLSLIDENDQVLGEVEVR